MLPQPAFGVRLRALREKHGLSQAALAEGGLSTGYLSRLESGARPPTARAVTYLAQRLGVPISALESPDGTELQATTPASPFAQILAAVISATDDNSVAEPLAEALRSDDKWDPALRWQAIWLLAEMRGAQGEREEQCRLLQELVELSENLHAPPLEARAQTQLSRCMRTLGDITAARDHALQAHHIADQLSLTDQANALQALVSAEAEAGQLTDARTHADELCDLTRNAGGTLPAEALWAAATVRIREGHHTEALTLLEDALHHTDARQDLILWMRLQLAAASLCLQMTPTQPARARTALDTVAPVLNLIGTDRHQQELQSLLATLAFEEGNYDDAWQITTTIDNQRPLLSFRDSIKIAALRARLVILRGDSAQGIQLLQNLANDAQQAQNVELAAELWRNLAETLAGLHDHSARS
ncbi:helix-turn-helix domain-containing protein [Micromonosporaceae bacterium Da 78-11]